MNATRRDRPETREHARWLAALLASSSAGRGRRALSEHDEALDRLMVDLGLERAEVVVRAPTSPAALARIEPG